LGEKVALFLSTYLNKVDRKGRVSVPATFRSALENQRYHGIVVFPSFQYPALEGAGGDYMEELGERLETLQPFSSEYNDLSMLFAESRQLPFDGEGRVILTDDLKEHARIDTEAMFVGRGAMFQIWEPSRFAEHRAAARQRLSQGAVMPPRIASPRPQ
jgi:MraZ protein